jgi:hypothetical protein
MTRLRIKCCDMIRLEGSNRLLPRFAQPKNAKGPPLQREGAYVSVAQDEIYKKG